MTDTDRLTRMERLLELTRNLSATLDEQTFLQSLIDVAGELTGSEAASILQYEDASGQLLYVVVPWFQREALLDQRVPITDSLAGQTFTKGAPLIVNDVQADRRHWKGADQATGLVTRSLVAVPLLFKGQPLGVLEAINKNGNAHYTEEDITILETLAAQAALAIQNQTLQRRVQSTYEELAQLDRMKTDFIAIASHELRTPLGLILGHATFLRETIAGDHREQIDIIVRNAERLKEIIESLANMDNVQSGVARLRSRAVSVRRIIEEVAGSFQSEARGKGLTLTINAPDEDLVVEGDAGKISIALSNLTKNALAFTDRGGHVFVTAERVPGYVKVSVIDDGIGIPASDLPRIFDRFYQVETHLTRRHGGMGLGLSVARVMVEMHGGRIWAESVEGRGSNFSFLLPVDPAQADAASRVFF